MIDPRQPKYQWGQQVRCTIDLVNDGPYPNVDEDALLVELGGVGEIVQVGAHVDFQHPDLSRRVQREIRDRVS